MTDKTNEAPPLLAIDNIEIYDPGHRGSGSILTAYGRVAAIRNGGFRWLEATGLTYEVLYGKGCIAVPGFVDPHSHIIGAGGEKGFASRMPEVQVSELVLAGITTVVGCLGTDSTTRHLTSLVAKCRALAADGITAYMYTGSFQVPTPTITGRVVDDIVLIPEIIGVGEVAISDWRSSEPSVAELARLASEAAVGGSMTGKAGVLHLHVGPGKRLLSILHELLDQTETKPETLYATHVERTKELTEDAAALAKRGAYVDMDTVEPGIGASIRTYLAAGGPPEKLSVSSDAHTTGSAKDYFAEFRACIKEHELSLEQVLPCFTCNPATALKLERKGRIAEGADADLLLLDKDSLEIRHVIAGGRIMVRDGRCVAPSPLEKFATGQGD